MLVLSFENWNLLVDGHTEMNSVGIYVVWQIPTPKSAQVATWGD